MAKNKRHEKKQKNTFEPTEEALLKSFKRAGKPLGMGQLAQIFPGLKKEKQKIKLLLKGLVKRGALLPLKNGMYGLADKMDLIRGTLSCTRSGNGFVIPDKEGIEDIFVPSRFMKNAFNGDTVMVRVEGVFRGKKEGKVVEIINRNTKNIIGYVKFYRNVPHIAPEDTRLSSYFVVTKSALKGTPTEGSLAAARITRFPDSSGLAECELIKVFKGGLDTAPAVATFIEYKHNLPLRFKRSTELEAKGLETKRPAADLSQKDRVDLRKLKHVTIDGETAKDFDDAVCVEKTRKGYTLFVSIADVSAYVSPGSQIDLEAYERGTSIYFPGKVLPMLPKILSNDLCSLNPDEDKLALTAKIIFNNNADVTETAFFPSIIRSVKRLTYRQVEDVLIVKDKTARKDLKNLLRELDCMRDLVGLLTEKRDKRGSLDFDLPEPQVILDIEGGIKDIVRAERLFAHRLIEEFMVAANEAVARYLRDNKLPAIYRIHEAPEREKLRDIEKLVHTLPLERRISSEKKGFLQSLLQSARGTDYEYFVNRVLLRSMKQARYSPLNKGHFGLASDCYLHFTSPIRRYPDLVCHRSLKSHPSNRAPYNEEELERMASHLSDRERTAMEAERELEDRIRILFMKDKLGETYEGIISHITAYGFFVELTAIFVEGLVLLADLTNDYYHFEESRLRLIGRRTRKIYRIGDKITIKVAAADAATNRLHFSPVI